MKVASIAGALVVGLSLAATLEARADQACTDAYDKALALSDAPATDPAGLATASRSCLQLCARTASDQSTLTECEGWKAKAGEFLAFASFEVRGEDGALVPGGEVSIDSKPPQAITVAPIEMNPGSHTFKLTIKLPSGPQTLSVSEGFNSRESKTVKFSFERGKPPVGGTVEVKGGVPIWAWIIGGFGIVSAGTGAVLLGIAADGQARITAECKQLPNGTYTPAGCADSVSENNLKQGMGGVFLGVGGVALIVGIVGIATAPKSKPPTQAIEFVPVLDPTFAGGFLRAQF